MKWLRGIGVFGIVLALGPALTVACGSVRLGQDWRTADRSPTGIAPAPGETEEAVVQVYAARAFNWRGIFAVHTWIATKERGASYYEVHQVMGWRAWRGLPVVMSNVDHPDRSWYGAEPEVVGELRGAQAEAAIPKIRDAVARYPYPDRYTVWPGPNSNTFTAFVGREVPELALDLPVTAIGKDYLTNGSIVSQTPSNTGVQLSLFGLLGVLAALEEGVEVNVLGLSFGLDLLGPAIKLPGFGRLGPG